MSKREEEGEFRRHNPVKRHRSSGSTANVVKHQRALTDLAPSQVSERMEELKTTHMRRTQDLLDVDGAGLSAATAALQQSPLSSADDAYQSRLAGSFREGSEPKLVKNWMGPEGIGSVGPEGLFTIVHPEWDFGFAGPVDRKEATRWTPVSSKVTPSSSGRAHQMLKVQNPVPSGPGEPPLWIGSRDGRTAFRLVKALGMGAYGAVVRAMRVNVADMKDTGESIALKFMLIGGEGMKHMAKFGKRTLLSPKAAAGMFVQYIFQRSYGGCMPLAVCMEDAFLFCHPKDENSDEMVWYAVIAMESMEGNVGRLIMSSQFRSMSVNSRYLGALMVACKMARAVYDLELMRIYHDDIKPENFLYSMGSRSDMLDVVVKTSDFDLGSFGSRTLDIVDSDLIYKQLLKDYTGGSYDSTIQPWSSSHGTSNMLSYQFGGTPAYRPPEHHVAAMVTHMLMGADREREIEEAVKLGQLDPDLLPTTRTKEDLDKFRRATSINADWTSRMMAFELLCAIRELFICAMLGWFYNPHDRSYPTEIFENPDKANRVAVHTYDLIRFGPNTCPSKIESPYSKRWIATWTKLRDRTIARSDIGGKYKDGVAKLNNILATVIAPLTPSSPTSQLYPPMRSVNTSNGTRSYLCIPQGEDKHVDRYRPTVAWVLKTLVGIAADAGILPKYNPDIPGGWKIPENVDQALETDKVIFPTRR